MIPAFIAGRGQQEAKEAATEILEFMGLAERASHKPVSYTHLHYRLE